MFPQRRLLPFYIDCLFTVVLYAIFKGFTTGFTAGEFFRSMFFGYTIVENGWYLQAILVFYVLFYFVFSTKLGTKLKILLMLAASLIYMDVCIHYGRGEWWYSSILSLSFGFAWGAYAERVEAFLTGLVKYVLTLLASLAAFCVLFALSVKTGSMVLRMLSAPAFTAASSCAAVSTVPARSPRTGIWNLRNICPNSGMFFSPETAPDIVSIPNISVAKPSRIIPVSFFVRFLVNI